MTITIELKDGFYYWTLKDDNGITNDWATSLGNVFEQIIEDRAKLSQTVVNKPQKIQKSSYTKEPV